MAQAGSEAGRKLSTTETASSDSPSALTNLTTLYPSSIPSSTEASQSSSPTHFHTLPSIWKSSSTSLSTAESWDISKWKSFKSGTQLPDIPSLGTWFHTESWGLIPPPSLRNLYLGRLRLLKSPKPQRASASLKPLRKDSLHLMVYKRPISWRASF
jgi:hypothetical protein